MEAGRATQGRASMLLQETVGRAGSDQVASTEGPTTLCLSSEPAPPAPPLTWRAFPTPGPLHRLCRQPAGPLLGSPARLLGYAAVLPPGALQPFL